VLNAHDASHRLLLMDLVEAIDCVPPRERDGYGRRA
jgi:hypothetical protein